SLMRRLSPRTLNIAFSGVSKSLSTICTQLSRPTSKPASTRCNSLVLFSRNVKPHRVGFENRRDLRCFLEGYRRAARLAASDDRRLNAVLGRIAARHIAHDGLRLAIGGEIEPTQILADNAQHDKLHADQHEGRDGKRGPARRGSAEGRFGDRP